MGAVIQDNGQVAYLASLNLPISISVMNKLSSWSFQNQLTYNAILPYICNDFMGLQDMYQQLSIYSQAYTPLNGPWAAVEDTLKLNLNVNKEMYVDPNLGQVGNLFQTIPSFSKVFASSSDDSLTTVQEDAS